MQLNYKSFGQGSPVIILHGLFGMLDNWMSFGKKLSMSHEVFIVDQRNHGRSFQSETFNYDVLADDLMNFVRTHQINNPSIIGHSMGGKVVMSYALKYPDQVDKQIVIDIGPGLYPQSHLEYFNAVLSLNLRDISSRREAEQNLSTHISDKGILLFLLKNLDRKKDNLFGWKANFEVLLDQYDNILSRIPIPKTPLTHPPSLFIKGSRSPYLRSDDIHSIRKYFVEAELKEINSGHWVHAEKPNELLKIIKDYLH